MIEFSITELALFAWAVLATGYAFKYVGECNMHRQMLMLFLENKEARERMLAEHAKWMEETQA
jgi:hypothetical protein